MVVEDDLLTGKSVRAAFIFDPSESNEVEIRVGISAVDQSGAFAKQKTRIG